MSSSGGSGDLRDRAGRSGRGRSGRAWRGRALRAACGLIPVALLVALAAPGGEPTASAAGTADGARTAASTGSTLYAHDADGRVTAVFDGSGAGSKISYDHDGNITAVTAMSASTLAVAQVSPQSATAGATVTIYGTDFGSSPSVTLGGAAAAVQSSGANEIVATVPSAASGSGVSVTAGGVTATGSFAVIGAPAKPAVTGLSEQVGNPASTLTVTGSGFSASAASDVASVNGTKVGVTTATSTSLQVELPPLAVAGPLTVTTPGGTAVSSGQIVTPPPPYLTANVGFAGGLANGTQTTMTLSSANQIALGTFSVSAGQRASVTVNADIPDPDEPDQYTISIYGPGGRLMTNDQDGGEIYNPQTWYLPDAAPAGVYEVVLVPVNGDTGSFQVTASGINDPSASMTVGGAAVTINVPVAGERPKWTFTGTAGQNVYVQWSNACGCTTQLLGPDGTSVAFDEGVGAFLTAQLPSSGTYTLVMDVDQSEFTNTGAFTAQVSAIPADASAATTVGGTAGSVTISAPGEDADVTFSGTAGQQVFTQASFSPAPDGGGIAVFAPDGSLVGQATYDSGSKIAVDTITLPETGTYKVKLSQLTQVDQTTFDDIGYTGSASVTVTSAPTVTGSTTVDGTAASLSLTASGQHGVVTFTGTAGEMVFTKLTMSPAEASTGTVTLLQEPGGTTVGSNSMTGSSSLIDTVTLPASGSYEIVVDPVDGTGGYTGTITVGVNSAPDQSGTTSVNGTPASVALAKPGEQAVVSLAGTAGQEVFTQIAFTGSPAQCGSADLQDTASGVVNFASGCLNSPPVFIDDTSLPDSATYQIVVTPSGGYTGTVKVTVTTVPAPLIATGTYSGAAVKVTTTEPGQDAVITYTGVPANATTEVNVTASTFAASDELSGYLNDPDGNAIAFCDDTVGVACTATSSVAGSYTLDLDHYGPFTGSTSAQLIAAPADGPAIFHPAATGGTGPGLRAPVPSAPAPKVRAPRRPRLRSAMAGAWRPGRRSGPPLWSWAGAARRRPAASLTGTIVTTAGAPLPGVTVSVGGHRARTTGSGQFRLTGLPQGTQVLEMDGRTASTTHRAFGVFDVQVQLRARVNRLPFTSYFPVLDTAHEVPVTEPLARAVTLTTPSIPGLAVHLPKGAFITDADGKPVYKLGITAIPVQRTPIPMPVDEQVPVYFTVQPAGGHITNGWATIDYPNYHHAAAGTSVDFWHYDLHGAGWNIYGAGTVNKAGTQVTPNKGTWVTDFNGAMISVSGYPDPGQSWLAKFLNFAGDPIDPSTGLYHMTQTDLTVNDVMPLTLTRGYNPGDGNPRQFGNNSSDIYDTFLTHDQEEPELYTEADLNLVDGGRVHFARITPGTSYAGCVMEAQSTSPEFFGATLAWNGEGWNLTLRNGMVLVYGENAPLQEIRDSHGDTVRIIRMYQNVYGNYDGPITQVISPNGYWMAFTWDNYDNPSMITKVTDNAGRSVSYAYDSNGNLHTVTDPDGHVTTYGYDSDNRLTTITDPHSTTYLTNSYNSSNQLTSQAIAGQGTYMFSYSSGSAKVTEPDGTTRDLSYDSNGYLASDERAVGTSSAHDITVIPDTANAGGELPGSVTDGLGRTVSTSYDSSGDELTNTYTSGSSSVASSATYNGTPFGLPDSATRPDGSTEHYTYDGGGDMTSVTDPLGNKGAATYDSQGNQLGVTSPLGNTTTSAYTGGLLTSATDPLGRVSHYVYDQAGRLVEAVSPDGATATTTYDADNQVASTTDADGYTTTYAYDGNGNLTKITDPMGNATTFGYNNADELTSVTDALAHIATYAYNAAGQVTSVTDPDGHKTVYTYDPLGRLTFAGYGATSSGTYQSTLTYTYNAATGDLASVADTTAGAGTITYAYDAQDHITSQTGPGGTVSYVYNSAGQLTSMTPPGQSAISYAYNADERLIKEIQGTQAASFSYDADGRLTSETMPNGITAAYTYDKAAELTGISYASGSTTVGTVTYGYDADGWRISEGGTLVNTVLPAPQSGSTYNADNELTSFGGKTYTYDADGNLLSDGTNTYNWNDRGQLASVTTGSSTSTLGYDPLGRMISSTVGGVSTTFAYQGSQLMSETPSGGTSTQFLDSPYGTLGSTTGSAVQAYLPDALGSTLALVNSAGQVTTSYSYNIFGAATSSAGTSDPNPVRYTGLTSGSVMPAGLQDNNARDYSSATGRFISADPSGQTGSGDNLYAYAGDDTADNSDPSGLQWQLLAGCAVGALVNDIGGALDGRKHSLGDFFAGAGLGCVGGALMTIGGAEEALDALEGGDIALTGADGSEDLASLGDDLSGAGVAEQDAEAAASEQAMAVIGRQIDTAIAKDWAEHEVLDLPANEWTLVKNDQWVQSVIERKMSVYVGSDTLWPNLWDAAAGRQTVFARELGQFLNAGYTWDGWTLIPPGGG
jgi:RHS repeat-associated protein